ncbi:nucleoside hydrolase [Shigella flexneri]
MAANFTELDLQLMTTVTGNASNPQCPATAAFLECGDSAGLEPLCSLVRARAMRHLYTANWEWLAMTLLNTTDRDSGYRRSGHSGCPDACTRARYPVAIGPLTNIALLPPQCPECKPYILRLVIMGGSAGRGNCTPVAEFNTLPDPEAAACVFRSGIEIVMCGLDVTNQAILTPEYLVTLPELNRTGKIYTPV